MFGLLLLSYAEDQSSIAIAHTLTRACTLTVTAPITPLTPTHAHPCTHTHTHVHIYHFLFYIFANTFILKAFGCDPSCSRFFPFVFGMSIFSSFSCFAFAFGFLMLVDWCAHTHTHSYLMLCPAHSLASPFSPFAHLTLKLQILKSYFSFRARLIGFIFGPELG